MNWKDSQAVPAKLRKEISKLLSVGNSKGLLNEYAKEFLDPKSRVNAE